MQRIFSWLAGIPVMLGGFADGVQFKTVVGVFGTASNVFVLNLLVVGCPASMRRAPVPRTGTMKAAFCKARAGRRERRPRTRGSAPQFVQSEDLDRHSVSVLGIRF